MLLKKRVPLKYILSKIKYEFLFITIYAIVIGIFDEKVPLEKASVTTGISMILGTILSLLLAFKSNQAYMRWWEARIIWGAIVNDSRSLARQVINFTRSPDPKEGIVFAEKIVNRQIAWVYALGRTLRHQEPQSYIEPFMDKQEMDLIKAHQNIPNGLIFLHTRDISRALNQNWINDYQQIELEKTISRLCDSMGKSERIKNTVFPTTYSMYVNFTLWIFILIFPFALTEYFGIMEIPIMIAISSALLLVERMAIQLQDPFENKPTDIPLTALANTIERNLEDMMSYNKREPVFPALDGGFYVM